MVSGLETMIAYERQRTKFHVRFEHASTLNSPSLLNCQRRAVDQGE
jgi:hypothetical protein